jgi:hypothetical protein
VKFKVVSKERPVTPQAGIAILEPRVDWTLKNTYQTQGLDFDSQKVAPPSIVKGEYPALPKAPIDVKASAHAAYFRLAFAGDYAYRDGGDEDFKRLDAKGIDELLKSKRTDRHFDFPDKEDVEKLIFVLRTDKGLPVKMRVKVLRSQLDKRADKRNALLQISYVAYQ